MTSYHIYFVHLISFNEKIYKRSRLRDPAARESQRKLTGTLTEGERRKIVWERERNTWREACRKVVHALHGKSDMKKDLNFSNEPSHSRIKLVIVTLAIHCTYCIISMYNDTRYHFILFLFSKFWKKLYDTTGSRFEENSFIIRIYDICFNSKLRNADHRKF